MSVARSQSLVARWLLVSVVFAIGACSSGADTDPNVGGTVAGDGPSSSMHAPRADRQDESPTPAAYQASVRRIGAELRTRMRFSHHAGCPVRWQDLRYLRMTYVDFDGIARTGEMVVNKRSPSRDEGLRAAVRSRWPIARMRLVDDYRGIDLDRWRPTTRRATTVGTSLGVANGLPMRTAQQSTSTPCRTPI